MQTLQVPLQLCETQRLGFAPDFWFYNKCVRTIFWALCLLKQTTKLNWPTVRADTEDQEGKISKWHGVTVPGRMEGPGASTPVAGLATGSCSIVQQDYLPSSYFCFGLLSPVSALPLVFPLTLHYLKHA